MNIVVMDLLLNLSNLLLLLSYSVRDILWLRWFAIASALMGIPYYALRQNVLWPPVFWGVVFLGINFYQLARVYAERRPVQLSSDERALYNFGFKSVDATEFVSLVLIGEWRDAAAGEQLLTERETVSSVCIATAGTIQISRHGRKLTTIEPGHLIGAALALIGSASPVSATFIESGRYIRWPLSNLRALLDKKPDLRLAMQNLVDRDLADKLDAISSFAA